MSRRDDSGRADGRREDSSKIESPTEGQEAHAQPRPSSRAHTETSQERPRPGLAPERPRERRLVRHLYSSSDSDEYSKPIVVERLDRRSRASTRDGESHRESTGARRSSFEDEETIVIHNHIHISSEYLEPESKSSSRAFRSRPPPPTSPTDSDEPKSSNFYTPRSRGRTLRRPPGPGNTDWPTLSDAEISFEFFSRQVDLEWEREIQEKFWKAGYPRELCNRIIKMHRKKETEKQERRLYTDLADWIRQPREFLPDEDVSTETRLVVRRRSTDDDYRG